MANAIIDHCEKLYLKRMCAQVCTLLRRRFSILYAKHAEIIHFTSLNSSSGFSMMNFAPDSCSSSKGR